MDNSAEVLARILDEMSRDMARSRKAARITEKISQGKATYEDALEYARESGRIMTGSLKKNLPDVLTDGKLYRAEADVVVRQPMRRSGKQVAETAAEIQQRLNEEAEIGINAIVPEVNEDQITGIITDICNADSYESGMDRLFTQIENFLEGTVDDCVRENAGFHYEAGLEPTIERRAVGKCCSWCSAVAGTYRYADVSDKGNDVFRRHKNCHCIVSYNPGNGSKRRQNVHSRQWTDAGRNDRIAMAERQTEGYHKNPSYNSKADPMAEVFGRGVDSHPEEIEAFREECRRSGVTVIERDHESLTYQPSPTIGRPGQLAVNRDASYAAWSHEMKHMRDDRESGWDGALRLWDKDDHVKREEAAYAIEIKMAEEAGRKDIADRLRENLEAERRRIYGSP